MPIKSRSSAIQKKQTRVFCFAYSKAMSHTKSSDRVETDQSLLLELRDWYCEQVSMDFNAAANRFCWLHIQQQTMHMSVPAASSSSSSSSSSALSSSSSSSSSSSRPPGREELRTSPEGSVLRQSGNPQLRAILQRSRLGALPQSTKDHKRFVTIASSLAPSLFFSAAKD